VVIAKTVSAQDMFAVLLVVVAALAKVRKGLQQEGAVVRGMGIVTGSALPCCDGRMHVRPGEHFLVVALIAETGDLRREGFFRFLFAMGGSVTGRTSLLHAGVLGHRRVYDAFGNELLMTIDAGSILFGSSCSERYEYTGKEKSDGQYGAAKDNDGVLFAHEHAAFYRIEFGKSRIK